MKLTVQAQKKRKKGREGKKSKGKQLTKEEECDNITRHSQGGVRQSKG